MSRVQSLKDRALTGIAWSAVERGGAQGMNALVYLVLVALVEPRAFGIIALAGVVVAFTEVFVDQGFSHALVQREELERGHLDTGFWTNLAFGAVLMAAVWLLADVLAGAFDEPGLAPVLRWMSAAFVIGALSGVQRAIFRRELDFKTLSIRSLIAVGSGGAVGIGMAVSGLGVWALVGQELTRRGVGAVVLWTASDWRPGLEVGRGYFMDLFSFGVNVAGVRILDFVNTRFDDLLVGYFLGSVALGYYSVAYNGLRALTVIITQVGAQVGLPLFSRLQNEPVRLRSAFYKATRFSAAVAMPVFLGTAILAPLGVRTVFGAQWLPSVPVMQVLCFIGVLHSINYFNSSMLLALGKPSWRLVLNAINAAANAVAFFIAVHFGIVAVAFAFVLRGYLLWPLHLGAVKRLLEFDLGTYFRGFAGTAGATALMAAGVWGVLRVTGAETGWAWLVGAVLAGASAYVVFLRLLAPELVREALDHSRRVWALIRS